MPKRPLTNIEARNKLNQLGLNYDFSLFEYNKSRLNYSTIICPEHGVFENNFLNIVKCKNGLICKECRYEHQQLILFKNIYGDDFDFKQHLIKIINCIEDNNINVDVIPENIRYGTTNKNKNEIKLICNKHGEFLTTYKSLNTYKRGCPDCRKEKQGRGKRIYNLEYIQKLATKRNAVCLNKKYLGINGKYVFRCENNNIFTTTLRMILNKGVWCDCKICQPFRKSDGEDRIREFLDNKNILYITEKQFDDLKSDKNRPLSFDFYLPDYNMCIEYDGEHHFKPIDYFGGVVGHKRMVVNDNRKNWYCKYSDKRLLRICCYDKENIEIILVQQLIDNESVKIMGTKMGN